MAKIDTPTRGHDSTDTALWLVTTAAGVIGALLLVIGFVLLQASGPGILIAGILLLFVAVGSHFVRTGRRRS